MPLASWLSAFLPSRAPSKPTPAAAKSPASAEGIIDTSTLLSAQMPAVAGDEPDLADNGVRMHIAAHDPEFPAKREAAVKSILSAIDEVALAHGFTKKAKSWAKAGTLGTVSIHLQRSLYGFDCHINLGFQPLDGEGCGPWALDDFVQLGRFVPPAAMAGSADGTLTYLDVYEDAGCLAELMQVLNDQALPWLDAQLSDPNAHSLPFLSGLTPVP